MSTNRERRGKRQREREAKRTWGEVRERESEDEGESERERQLFVVGADWSRDRPHLHMDRQVSVGRIVQLSRERSDL